MSRSSLVGAAVLALVLAAFAVAGCGDSEDSDNPTALKISVIESGKKATFSVPKSVTGGLVELTLHNQGKAPHGVQLIRYEGDHSAADALKEVESEKEKIPDWLRAEGGIGSVLGGDSGSATLNLEPGNFVISDAASIGEGGGPSAELKVTDGDSGDLPDTEAEVVAAETGDDEYEWEVSGLKSGEDITFDSEGDEALHLIIAAPVKGKAPSQSQLEKDFSKEGPPPPYLDFEGAQSTAVLDGGKSQTTPLDLKPGQYIFFCPLTDRDGGKQHDEEGLLSVETVE